MGLCSIDNMFIAVEEYSTSTKVKATSVFDIRQWTMTHAMFYQSNGFRLVIDNVLQEGKPKRNEMVYLARHGHIQLKETLYAIQDKSKADCFSKTIAGLQILWFAVQTLARVIKHLPLTAMELATVSVVLAALFTQYLCWHKPLDVKTYVPILITTEQKQEMDRKMRVWDDLGPTRNNKEWGTELNGDMIFHSAMTAALAAGTVIGALHTLAWSFHFPSEEERWLWRISSVLITSITAVYFLVIIIECLQGILEWDFVGIAVFIGAAYFVCRLILLALQISCLRSLPVEYYQTVNWTIFLPHL